MFQGDRQIKSLLKIHTAFLLWLHALILKPSIPLGDDKRVRYLARGTSEAWGWCFGTFIPRWAHGHASNSHIFRWGYHLLAMLSQYLESFMSIFTEKTTINKKPPGLSLGKQVTKELSKCFCLSAGLRFYGLSSSSPGALSLIHI